MIRNQCLMVLRNARKRKLSTTIIILSLAFGLSVATVLFAFVRKETRTDFFHTHAGSIYRLLSSDPFSEQGKTLSFIKKTSSEYIASSYPEIKRLCKITDLSGNGLTIEHQRDSYESNMVLAVDSSFYHMFDFPFLQGSKDSASKPQGIVITKNLALKIYERPNVLGEELIVNYDTFKIPFTVTGVLDNVTENTHFKFDALLSFSVFNQYLSASTTYLMLNDNVDRSFLEQKISKDKQTPSLVGPGACQYFLQPLTQIYFDKGNVKRFTMARDHNFITVIWVIIFFILFIGIFNFINLFLTSFVERKKEFGVKKVQGATMNDIRIGMALEVTIYLVASLFLSLVITIITLPSFNQLFETNLDISYITNPSVLKYIGPLFVLLIIFISYTLSFYLNKIKPIHLINENKKLSFHFNKVLFTLQFVLSMMLILSSAVTIKQMDFIKHKQLGFDRQIMEIKVPKGGTPSELSALKAMLEQQTAFKSISLAGGNPVTGNQIVKKQINSDESYSVYFMEGDENIIKTLGLKLKVGMPLSPSSGHDKIVNEKFVEYFNINDPIGAPIPGGAGDKIIGVISDFNVSSLKQEIPIYMIAYKREQARLLINYSGIRLDEARQLIEKSWKKVFINSPFTYTFLDEQLLSRHQEDFYFSRIIITFASLSILITCFGLFALAQSHCQKKSKEIAIRKSLGASVNAIISLLIFDFAKWIALSFVLASIFGYFSIQYWIQTFAYRTEITWTVFAVTAAVGGVISLLAISIQTIKASKANPIRGLRYE